MGWSRRWLFRSREHWRSVLGALLAMSFDPARQPVEMILRKPRVEKTHDQRKLFHAICAELAPHIGLTPGEAKQLVKQSFYGVERKLVLGRVREFTQSSEDSDREEYSRLIDHAYQVAAEAGVVISERRS